LPQLNGVAYSTLAQQPHCVYTCAYRRARVGLSLETAKGVY